MGCVFGPVPSRRLGRSLGVDLVPFKTCTYDCIYCQLGRTTRKTVTRREWVPLEDVLSELKDKLTFQPDHITLSGSGEPTLYSRLGELIEGIRSMTQIPVAVLTNGSLLWDPQVRRDLTEASIVIPSLDAGTEDMFQAVNRPHPHIPFEEMLEGLRIFRSEYHGAYWLEVFILAGHTAVWSEARKIARLAKRIGPDRVQLNTACRPAAEDYAVGVDPSRLQEISRFFHPPAEIIADFEVPDLGKRGSATREAVYELLKRRPCGTGDVASGLGLHPNEALKYIEELVHLDFVEPVKKGSKIFYRARL
ncbi:Wyosine [tRNA(Phe)-imidazoG37] synthetase, radical SAM superfamily [Desulfacinum infernum DSM 9756]|uniref:Wyosine [tRNA(Phe)-imidazoG37] synthetase, radical SAM superfamily n=1 Tax=Desulfacinum infernum DSM 9756 TaxID=1121391 RepID=A0A1M5I0B4_9BACT|nr:radical SAM protein [Desulfacinum infernum]SHG21587.1 Wyosine [tRNA(Phe)-imidazoG37] synthetase, radical SAM superfamily [Desulfacinum infernum DSM 9756]